MTRRTTDYPPRTINEKFYLIFFVILIFIIIEIYIQKKNHVNLISSIQFEITTKRQKIYYRNIRGDRTIKIFRKGRLRWKKKLAPLCYILAIATDICISIDYVDN